MDRALDCTADKLVRHPRHYPSSRDPEFELRMEFSIGTLTQSDLHVFPRQASERHRRRQFNLRTRPMELVPTRFLRCKPAGMAVDTCNFPKVQVGSVLILRHFRYTLANCCGATGRDTAIVKV